MLLLANVQKSKKLLSGNMPITETWTNSEDSTDGYYYYLYPQKNYIQEIDLSHKKYKAFALYFL